MKKRNNIIIGGVVGVAFILFFIFVYLPYADRQNGLNKVSESMQHSAFLKDSINHVPVFSLTDQNGKLISQQDIEGQVFVADFFYTTCEAYCPITTAELVKVQKAINPELPFKILSFSLDEKKDSVSVLKNFAQHYGADDRIWHFLHGDAEDINTIGENGFYTIVQDAQGSFAGHSDKFTLVDKSGNIRGFYKGTDSIQVKALIMDINYLLLKDKAHE